ncbi:MAG: hypothetical protein FWD62_15740 [Betaproteobacteria bacterium]|nr:hypothetical protein [Betaproteobacteria bacterium]
MSLFLANSRFTKRTYLMNAYASKGTIRETGVVFDATHLWLMTPQKNPGGTMGLGYEAVKWGDSTNYERIKHINLLSTGPIQVEVELEEVMQGQGEREKKITVVHNLRIVQPGDDQASPAKKSA